MRSTTMLTRGLAGITGLLFAITACQRDAEARAAPPPAADTIYMGGSILTMAGKEAVYVEALAVQDGRIVFAGAKDEALKRKGAGTTLTDLGGRHLMPSFIDGHGHFINALSVAGQANCHAAPFGPGSTKEGIIASVRKLIDDRKIPKGEVVMGYGYDDSIYPEGGKLTAADHDPYFPEHPVMVGHVSLHGAVLNSLAMKKGKEVRSTLLLKWTSASERPP